ncbi:MAG: acyltransferase [Lentimicrobiaceae bacterium]|nr:acyltransferase [Lentimicrobiaceae bacterium]
MIAMSFIIVCHIFQAYGNELAFWFNVGVQLFLIISGYLYYTKDYSNESVLRILKQQFIKILLPYYVWLGIVIVIYLLFSPQSLTTISVIYSFFCSGTLLGQGHLWFIPYILLCYLITPYLYYIKRKIHNTNLISTSIIWLIILGCIFIIMKLYKSYFKPEIISCYIIGYAIADIFSRFKRNNIRNKITFIICMAAIVFNAIKIYYCYFYKSELAGVFALIFAYFKSYTHVVLGLSIFLLFIHLCNNVKYNKILSFSDKYSYEIYLVHALFILSPLNLIFISDYVILNIVMAIVSTIICGMLLKYISSYISSVKFI